jgi:hypothetical protein
MRQARHEPGRLRQPAPGAGAPADDGHRDAHRVGDAGRALPAAWAASSRLSSWGHLQTTGSYAIGLMLLSDIALAACVFTAWRLRP